MATVRIHRGQLSASTLLGRGVGVDRLPVGTLGAGDVTEVTVPDGNHILQIRNGIYFSRALRYFARPDQVLEYEIRSVDAGLTGFIFGGWIELCPLHQKSSAAAPHGWTPPAEADPWAVAPLTSKPRA
jgi:hypothetical protein